MLREARFVSHSEISLSIFRWRGMKSGVSWCQYRSVCDTWHSQEDNR
jgi:hypothetical protein